MDDLDGDVDVLISNAGVMAVPKGAMVDGFGAAHRHQSPQAYSNNDVWIYELREGRIARLIEHTDTLRFARLAGRR